MLFCCAYDVVMLRSLLTTILFDVDGPLELMAGNIELLNGEF